MKLSSNFRFLKIGIDDYVVFDNFAVDIYFITSSLFEFLIKEDFKNISNSDINIFIEKNIIFLSEFDESNFLKDKINYVNKQMKSINNLYVSFTQRCNLNCNHCHFPKREPPFENINDLKIRDMISSWIAYIFETNPFCTEELWIIPYGGDPLLRKDLLFSLLDYIKEMKISSGLYKNVKVYVPTNADLMTFLDLHKFTNYDFVHIAFGLDGGEFVHCNSKNVSIEQFESLCSKIRMSVELKIDSSVSSIGSLELFNDFDLFLKLIKDLEVKKIAINFIRNSKVDNEEYFKSLEFVYENYYDELLALEFQLNKRVLIVETKSSFRIDCPCYGKQFTLFPDSTVGVCPFEKNGMISLDHFLSMDYEEKTKIKDININDYYEASVKNGFLYGGGCHWSNCQSVENKSFDELINKKLFLIIFKKIFYGKL